MSPTSDIRDLCTALDVCRGELSKLVGEEATLRMNRGQDSIAVSVCGRMIAVTAIQDQTYMPKLVRGMEMVQLGLLKWYAGQIEAKQAQVAKAEENVRRAVGGQQ